MYKAEVIIVVGRVSYQAHSTYCVKFDDLDKAKAEYARLTQVLVDRGNKVLTLARTIICGDLALGNAMSCPTDDISSIGFKDYVAANTQQDGVIASFPRLFPKVTTGQA